MTRVLVCGGRNFDDYDTVKTVLSALHTTRRITLLIHGGASGADTLAGQWARRHQIPVKVFPADWDTYGKGAGPLRNQQMLQQGKPDMVVAFKGGRGTADMLRRAGEAGLEIMRV